MEGPFDWIAHSVSRSEVENWLLALKDREKDGLDGGLKEFLQGVYGTLEDINESEDNNA